MEELINTQFEYEYDYSWILTCLYHDATTCIEDEKKKCSIRRFKKTIYNHKPTRLNVKLYRFTKELTEKYFDYRKRENKIEHGIYAGYRLFRELYNAFEKNTKGHDWYKNPEKIIDNISYRIEHLDHFAYIADAIICHNIWMSYDEETNEKYEKNGLEDLIIKRSEDRLSLEKYPLQFILCLLDTIEPVKRFKTLDAKTVLENVFIHIWDNTIKIGCSPIIREQDEFHQWFCNISELDKWMNVSVTECKSDGNICYKVIFYNT